MAVCNAKLTEEAQKLPTVMPDMYFHAVTDAKIFHSALSERIQKWQRIIINILANRSNEQLKEVEKTYKTMYDGDLRKELWNKSSNIQYRILLERFFGRYEYQAYELRSAMMGNRFDKRKLIRVICTKRFEEINKIKDTYKNMYKRDLIKDIQTKTSGRLGDILLSMLTVSRPIKVDFILAEMEAWQLFGALGDEDVSTNAKVFTNIFFGGRSFEQLRNTFLYYKHLCGRSLGEAIEKLRSGNLKFACLTVFQYIEDPVTYYSEVIFNALNGIENNVFTRAVKRLNFWNLKYVILSRCEIDLKSIKERFNKLHGTSLEIELGKWWSHDSFLNDLASDCSQMCSPVWQQVRKIQDAVETVLPDLEFGVSREIAFFALNVGFQLTFNAEHLTFNDEFNQVNGRKLSVDRAVAIANFAVIRDGRPVRIRWKIHKKMNAMWIGFTLDKSYVISPSYYWCKNGTISYYGGLESEIGSRLYPAIQKPILDKPAVWGYGSLQTPGVAKHMLQPYSKGDEIELELFLGKGGNGDWISLYHNEKPQLVKSNIDSFTEGAIKLFPFVLIDTPSDVVQMELVS